MTTTVTVKTHDWPVAVEASHSHNHATDHVVSRGYGSTTTFVPAHAEQTFNVTDTQTISVRELPKGATKLFDHEATEGAAANQAVGSNGVGGYGDVVNRDIADAGLAGER